MNENSSSFEKHTTKSRSKKLNPRIDLTQLAG